jgi:transcriptional regulator with XRE-family HTH domain
MARVAQVGEAIRLRRESLGLTQDELAERAGINKRTVERIEAGQGTKTSTICKIARALTIEPEVLCRASTPLQPVVWFIGSYSGQTNEQQSIISSLLPRLATGLIRFGIRLVCGESTMLVELAKEYRAALPRDCPFPCPVVLFGKLRGIDLRQLFMATIGSVPSVAVLMGGAVQKGRVREEYECAGIARIPVIVVPATGGVANAVTSTLKLEPRLAAAISKTGRSVDRGDLADATMEALLQVIGPRSIRGAPVRVGIRSK